MLSGMSSLPVVCHHGSRRGKVAAGMALSDDLRKRVVEAVVLGELSRNGRQAFQCEHRKRSALGDALQDHGADFASGGDCRSGRIEAQRDYLLGLIRRTPDITLLPGDA
jgi:hypothetical protein